MKFKYSILLIILSIILTGCETTSNHTSSVNDRQGLVLVKLDGMPGSKRSLESYAQSKELIDYLFDAKMSGTKMTTTTFDPHTTVTPAGPLKDLKPMHFMYVVPKEYSETEEDIMSKCILSANIMESGELWVQSSSWDPHSYWYLEPLYSFGYE